MSLICNIFGGPGVGKSATAYGVTSLLKWSGVSAELAMEYAKKKTWHKELRVLGYHTARQWYETASLDDQVNVVVTDSPLLTGLVYPGKGSTELFRPYLVGLHKEFNNINFFLERDKNFPYDTNGRNQNENEAIEKDIMLRTIMEEEQLPFEVIPVNGFRTNVVVYKKVMEHICKDIPKGLLDTIG